MLLEVEALLGNSNKKYGIHSHNHFLFHLSKIETSELLHFINFSFTVYADFVISFPPNLLYPKLRLTQ